MSVQNSKVEELVVVEFSSRMIRLSSWDSGQAVEVSSGVSNS